MRNQLRFIEQFYTIGGQPRNPAITEDGKILTWNNTDGVFDYKEDVYVVSVARETGTDRAEITMSDDSKVYIDLGALAWEDNVDALGYVKTVFGRSPVAGAITAQSGDYTAAQVTNAFDKTADDLDDITAGTTNKHFTVTYRNDVDLNTAARHTHSNKAVLDAITDAGSGQVITDYERSLIYSHAGVYEVPLTFSTGLNRTGNTVVSTITQYTDALARGSISLTTTGSSGAATYNSSTGVLNIPQYAGGSGMIWPIGSGIPTVVNGNSWGNTISNGAGFLKNDGTGVWSYDNSIYDRYLRWNFSVDGISPTPINSQETLDFQAGSGITLTRLVSGDTKRITISASGGGGGTVTSVGLSAPTGFSVSNSPVTTSGTLTLSMASGYAIPTTTQLSQISDAYNGRIISLTTSGSSGVATFSSNILNIPNYTLDGLNGMPKPSSTSLQFATSSGWVSLTGGIDYYPSYVILKYADYSAPGVSVASTFLPATTTEAGMMSAEDKTTLNSVLLNMGKASTDGSFFAYLNPSYFTSLGGWKPTTLSEPTPFSDKAFSAGGAYTALNAKQDALNGTGFVKISGTTISYDNNSYALLNGSLSQDFSGRSFLLPNSINVNGNDGIARLVNGGYSFALFSNGDASVDGIFTASELYRGSSKELKHNIKPYKGNALDILNATKIYTYNLNSDNSFGVGFLAEDTHKWLSGENQKSHAMGNHLGLLTKAIQEQIIVIEEMQKQISDLQIEIKKLKKRQLKRK